MVDGDSFYPDRLRCVDVPYIEQDVCNMMYSGQVTDTMFCLGQTEGGRDACNVRKTIKILSYTTASI